MRKFTFLRFLFFPLFVFLSIQFVLADELLFTFKDKNMGYNENYGNLLWQCTCLNGGDVAAWENRGVQLSTTEGQSWVLSLGEMQEGVFKSKSFSHISEIEIVLSSSSKHLGYSIDPKVDSISVGSHKTQKSMKEQKFLYNVASLSGTLSVHIGKSGKDFGGTLYVKSIRLVYTPSEDEVRFPEFSFSRDIVTAELGKPFVPPVLNNKSDGKLNFTSSVEGVATVDNSGKIVLVGPGATVITATVAATQAYYASKASYKLNVIDPNAAILFSIDSGDKAPKSKYKILEKSGIQISVDRGDLGTVSYYRIDKGGQMIISSHTFPITKVVFTCMGSSYCGLDPTKVSAGNLAKKDLVFTWTGNARDITFNASNRTRFSKIEVVVSRGGYFTIGEKGYATFYTCAAYEMPANVIGTTVTGIADLGQLNCPWEYGEGSTVPANTPLLLRSTESKTHTFNYVECEDRAPENNLLKGSLEGEMTVGGQRYYKLTKSNDGLRYGFFWGASNGAAFINPAGKCYLALPKIMNVRFFSLDALTTEIEGIQAKQESEPITIYTLQGKRVDNIVRKGIYIVNGKKIIKQ